MQTPDIIITPEMLTLIVEIDTFNREWSTTQQFSEKRLATLKKNAITDSIRASSDIEGTKLTGNQIEKLISSNIDGLAFSSPTTEKIAGFAQIQRTILNEWIDIDLQDHHVKQLHGMLFKYSDKDVRLHGEYKKIPNPLPGGIDTVSPFEAPAKLCALIQWYKDALATKHLHPLLVIAIFFAKFIHIRPFPDGNGRIIRTLTLWLMQHAGYGYVPFSSLESIFQATKEEQLMALKECLGSKPQTSEHWAKWITYFLHMVHKQKNNMARTFKKEGTLTDTLPLLSIHILEQIQERGRTTIKEIEDITGANRSTIKVRLRELVSEHHIIQQGKARATWYTLA